MSKKILLIIILSILVTTSIFAEGYLDTISESNYFDSSHPNPYHMTNQEREQLRYEMVKKGHTAIIVSLATKINELDTTFKKAFLGGYRNIIGKGNVGEGWGLSSSNYSAPVNIVYLFWISLLTLEIVYLGLKSLVKGSFTLSEFLMKLILAVAILSIILNLQPITETILDSMNKVVNHVSGTKMDDSSRKPGAVLLLYNTFTDGMNEVLAIVDRDQHWYEFNTVRYTMYTLILIINKIILFIIFMFAQLNVLLTYIEFYLLIILMAVLAPFIIFEPTKFVSRNFLQPYVGQFMKLLAILIALHGTGLIFKNLFGSVVAMDQVITSSIIFDVCAKSFFITIIFAMLITIVPSLAKAMLTGGPIMDTVGSNTIARWGSVVSGMAMGAIWRATKAPFAYGANLGMQKVKNALNNRVGIVNNAGSLDSMPPIRGI